MRLDEAGHVWWRQSAPTQALHLTGATLLVSRDIKVLQAARQVSLSLGGKNNLNGLLFRRLA